MKKLLYLLIAATTVFVGCEADEIYDLKEDVKILDAKLAEETQARIDADAENAALLQAALENAIAQEAEAREIANAALQEAITQASDSLRQIAFDLADEAIIRANEVARLELELMQRDLELRELIFEQIALLKQAMVDGDAALAATIQAGLDELAAEIDDLSLEDLDLDGIDELTESLQEDIDALVKALDDVVVWNGVIHPTDPMEFTTTATITKGDDFTISYKYDADTDAKDAQVVTNFDGTLVDKTGTNNFYAVDYSIVKNGDKYVVTAYTDVGTDNHGGFLKIHTTANDYAYKTDVITINFAVTAADPSIITTVSATLVEDGSVTFDYTLPSGWEFKDKDENANLVTQNLDYKIPATNEGDTGMSLTFTPNDSYVFGTDKTFTFGFDISSVQEVVVDNSAVVTINLPVKNGSETLTTLTASTTITKGGGEQTVNFTLPSGIKFSANSQFTNNSGKVNYTVNATNADATTVSVKVSGDDDLDWTEDYNVSRDMFGTFKSQTLTFNWGLFDPNTFDTLTSGSVSGTLTSYGDLQLTVNLPDGYSFSALGDTSATQSNGVKYSYPAAAAGSTSVVVTFSATDSVDWSNAIVSGFNFNGKASKSVTVNYSIPVLSSFSFDIIEYITGSFTLEEDGSTTVDIAMPSGYKIDTGYTTAFDYTKSGIKGKGTVTSDTSKLTLTFTDESITDAQFTAGTVTWNGPIDQIYLTSTD